MEKYFDVDISLGPQKTWSVKLRDITVKNPIGEIYGKMKWKKDIRIYVVEQSELDIEFHNKGLGIMMYETIIKKLLSLWPDCEIHSSSNLNQFSRGVWNKMVLKYHNVKKVGRHYEIKKSEKGVIG
jgi:hypothetical protein